MEQTDKIGTHFRFDLFS